jgi:hypothetical protein
LFIEIEHVEDHVIDGHALHQHLHRAGVADVHALLEEGKAGPALFIEGDHFAIENRAAAGELTGEGVQFRIARGDIEPVAAFHAQAAPIEIRDGAHAIPFEFEAIRFWIGWNRREHGQHRLNALRHRRGGGSRGWNLGGSSGHRVSSHIVLHDQFSRR